MARTFDPVWEEKYHAGHMERYPWDVVVSFVFRHAPRDRPRREVEILEIGCGTGSNLWFAAREGFTVAGIDGSAAAIAAARERFAQDGLVGELVVGDFTRDLPFAAGRFDLAIDRGALVCVGYSAAKRAIAEAQRVLKPGGLFLFNPYSQAHTSFSAATPAGDGLVDNVTGGTLVGVGQLCFYDELMVRDVFDPGWDLLGLDHIESRSLVEIQPSTGPGRWVHAEWRALVRKAVRPAPAGAIA